MTGHAKLSPSNKRWPYCAGSVREESVYPDVSGDAAIDGTGSHMLLELSILNNVSASNYDQLIIGDNHHDRPLGWLIDTERCKRVQIALDYVARRKKELLKQFPDAQISVEAESTSNPGRAFGRDDWWGTCDITITVFVTDLICFIEVVDYKDGRMYVSEKWNSQLIAYLKGKLVERIPGTMSDDIGLRMTIIQPKTNTPIRYQCSTNPDHGLTLVSFDKEVEKLVEAAKATDDPNAPLIPGKHCQWCKHSPKRGGTCTAAVEKSMEVTMPNKKFAVSDNNDLLDFISKAVSDVKSMSSEQLSKVADAEDGFKAAFDKVKKEIQERVETGGSVPGWAMSPGRASKVWAEDEETIVKKLKAKRFKKDEIYPAKLISPAAALKSSNLTEIQKKKVREELIVEMAGKMTLKKVEYEPVKDAGDMFIDVGVIEEKLITDKPEIVSFF